MAHWIFTKVPRFLPYRGNEIRLCSQLVEESEEFYIRSHDIDFSLKMKSLTILLRIQKNCVCVISFCVCLCKLLTWDSTEYKTLVISQNRDF